MDLFYIRIQGTKINYYFVCKRKLWFFDRQITMEHTSDKVLLGALLHQEIEREQELTEVLLNNSIRIDIFDLTHITEIKYSDRAEKAHRMQLLYYLYCLKKMGIERTGVLEYPRERKRIELKLTDKDIVEIERTLREIQQILQMPSPPDVEKYPYCPQCSYYELCYS